MRKASDYRSERKKRARRLGVALDQLDVTEARLKREAIEIGQAQAFAARQALGIWARTGGRVNILKGETEDGK